VRTYVLNTNLVILNLPREAILVRYYKRGEIVNVLNKLGEWLGEKEYQVRSSAQSFMAQPQFAMAAANSACGAGDAAQKEEKPSACGSACGAGDPAKKEEQPTAGGSACGAGDPAKKEEKPSACGSACGAGDPANK
jgi:ACGX-repeat protein